MDLFGKILVVVNFGLSLMMAAIGGAALYYRVDWTDTPAASDGSAPAGELVGRLDTIKRLKEAIPPVNDAWLAARGSLIAQQDDRKRDEARYVELLQQPLTNPAKQPILALVYEKDEKGRTTGRTVPDPANGNLPRMAPVADRYGKSLEPLVTYNAKLADVNKQLADKLGEIVKSEQQDAALTDRLIGTKELRGLIQRIKDEQVKQENLAKETELVTLGEGQVRADSQLLLLRKKALQARIKELEKTGVAAGQP